MMQMCSYALDNGGHTPSEDIDGDSDGIKKSEYFTLKMEENSSCYDEFFFHFESGSRQKLYFYTEVTTYSYKQIHTIKSYIARF